MLEFNFDVNGISCNIMTTGLCYGCIRQQVNCSPIKVVQKLRNKQAKRFCATCAWASWWYKVCQFRDIIVSLLNSFSLLWLNDQTHLLKLKLNTVYFSSHAHSSAFLPCPEWATDRFNQSQWSVNSEKARPGTWLKWIFVLMKVSCLWCYIQYWKSGHNVTADWLYFTLYTLSGSLLLIFFKWTSITDSHCQKAPYVCLCI